MNDITWSNDGYGEDGERGVYNVNRHGTGRKYWEAHYPDGTHVDNFLSREGARLSCESWEPDATLVTLVDDGQETLTAAGVSQDDVTPPAETGTLDAGAAAEESQDALTELEQLLRQVDLTDAGKRRANWHRGLDNLKPLAQMRAAVENLIAEQVERSRKTETTGYNSYYDYGKPTWEDVGKALGVTKQAAQSRYGKKS